MGIASFSHSDSLETPHGGRRISNALDLRAAHRTLRSPLISAIQHNFALGEKTHGCFFNMFKYMAEMFLLVTIFIIKKAIKDR